MLINSEFPRYDGASLDTPAFHLLFKPLLPTIRPLLAVIHCIRWQLSKPLQVRILPKWIPLIPVRILDQLYYITYGQVLLTLPLVLLILAGYTNSFSNPNLDESGEIAGFALLLTFVTATKSNSIPSFLLGIPVERMIPYHNLSALVALTLSGFHAYVAYVHGGESSDGSGSDDRRRLSEDSPYALHGPSPDFIKFCFDGGTNLSGSLIIVCMLVLVSTSFFSILRRWLFEFWLVTHILSAVGVIVFCLVHSVKSILLVAAWWLADIIFRYFIMLTIYPHKAKLTPVMQGEITEVRFPKTEKFDYNAGQYVYICIPGISVFQFHPVTIASSPYEEEVTLLIRGLGKWTRQVSQLAANSEDTNIFIEGPYGSLSMDLDNDSQYQMVLTAGGGIGITPCQSIARSLLHEHQHLGRKLHKLEYVWVTQKLDMPLSIPPPVLSDNDKSNVFSTHIFVTRLGSPPRVDEEEATSVNKTPMTPFPVLQGRPNWDSIFADMKKEAKDNQFTRVAVIGCGPAGMLSQLREACRRHSDYEWKCDGIKFDMHEEIFDF